LFLLCRCVREGKTALDVCQRRHFSSCGAMVDVSRGAVLRLDEASSAYRAADDGDLSAYADHGVTTLMIDENTAYTDVSDPTQNPTIVRGADIVDAIAKSGEGAAFDANNTRVTIASGRVVSISHLYLP